MIRFLKNDHPILNWVLSQFHFTQGDDLPVLDLKNLVPKLFPWGMLLCFIKSLFTMTTKNGCSGRGFESQLVSRNMILNLNTRIDWCVLGWCYRHNNKKSKAKVRKTERILKCLVSCQCYLKIILNRSFSFSFKVTFLSWDNIFCFYFK